jgi:hypothetical protein
MTVMKLKQQLTSPLWTSDLRFSVTPLDIELVRATSLTEAAIADAKEQASIGNLRLDRFQLLHTLLITWHWLQHQLDSTPVCLSRTTICVQGFASHELRAIDPL